MNYAARQRNLARELRHAGIEALLITHLPNIFYLCGFRGTAGVLMFYAGERTPKLVFFTDGRYTQQAAEQVKGAKVIITSKPALAEACERVAKARLREVTFEADHLSYSAYSQVKQMLGGKTRLKPLSGMVEQLRATKDAEEIEPVRDAQLASIEAVRPGVATGEVDKAGRQLLKKAGYDAWFTHSTGHGVGIEVHESPRLARGQTQKLSPGMVVTIEPGIYIPEEGGVRIEDMVLVTESGHEVLTPTTKDLIEL